MKSLLSLCCALAALGTSACGDSADEDEAEEFWHRIHALDYRSWERAPGWQTRTETVSAHGETADIFINQVVASAAAGESVEEWPTGVILVKDGYRADELWRVAAFEKRTNGSWFFAEWSENGEVKYAGQPSVCLGCHDNATDVIFSVPLP